MPPKKKGTKVPPAKKKAATAPAKRPVGRPRKAIGTRVSDYDVLANVGSTKPMPRRIGRDALEQQRARLRYAADYPGRRFTEEMTRALQDAFASGSLPYGVSLRAPNAFTFPYVPKRIAGMPVGTAMNEPPNAEEEQALLRLAAAVAAEEAGSPGRRIKRRLATAGPSGPSRPQRPLNRPQPGDTSEPWITDTKVADRQQANVLNAIEVAANSARDRAEDLVNLRRRLENARRRRQGLPAILSPDETLVTSFLRQNELAPKSGMRSYTDADPEFMRQRLEGLLRGLPTPTGPDSEQPTVSRPNLSMREARPSGVSPAGQAAIMREVARKRPTGLSTAQKEAAARLASSLNQPPPQRPPPQRPQQTLSSTSGMQDEIARLQQSVENKNRALAQPRPRSSADVERLVQERDEDINRIRYLLGSIDTSPPAQQMVSPQAQQMVISVPDPVVVNSELQALRLRELQLEEKIALQRAGKSKASSRLELEDVRGAIREIESETNAATPSSAPSVPSVPSSVQQSIAIPGTETPAPITYAPLSSAVSQATTYQQELIRSQQEIARLQEESRLQNLAMERAAASLVAQAQLAANEAGPSRPRVSRSTVTTASTGTYIDPSDLIRRNPTQTNPSGPRVGTVDAKMARGETVSLEERQRNFQRTADANQRAEALQQETKPSLKDIRSIRALAHLGPEQRRNLDDLIARRTNLPLPTRPPENVPTVTTQQLAMVPSGTQASLGPDVIVGPASIPDPPQIDIPPRSNPPEPTGDGLQHVTAATFPASKWTTASSLRWLRSNGLFPIRKSTKINGSYSYALQSPAAYSSFNSVKMSHKNKDFTIVYGTPK